MSRGAHRTFSVYCSVTSDYCGFKCVTRKLREQNPLTALWVVNKVLQDFEMQYWRKTAEKIPWCIIIPLQKLAARDWEVAVVIRMKSEPNIAYLVLSTFSIVQDDLGIPKNCPITNFPVYDTILDTYALAERLNMLKYFKCFFGDDPSSAFQKDRDDYYMRNFLSTPRRVIEREILPSDIAYIV